MSTTNILDLNNRIDALEKISHNVEPIQQQIDELKAWTDPGTKEASGNPIILTDGAAFNAEGLVVTCNPKQSGSGTPSPTNVRPITGLTETSINTFGGDNIIDTKNLTHGLPSTTIGASINTISSDDRYAYSNTVESSVDSCLIEYKSTNDVLYRQILFYAYKNDILVHYVVINSSITANVESKYIVSNIPEHDCIRVVFGAQLYGTVPTDLSSYGYFNLYDGKHTATITFGQTVYGGSVDFKTGKVTVTHANIASYNGETINEPWLSSIDEYVSGTTPTTGAQVVYPLTTPTELTLTPAELELLKGYNYITTNGNNIELTYQPDNLKADILLTVSQLYGSKISIFDGILTGGDTGQVLTKTSDDNYDATWATLPATRTTTKKSEK